MKNQKLHIFPFETTFLRKIQTGVQYFDESYYTNFSDYSLEIIPFNQSPQDEDWLIDEIFEKVLDTLSIHNMKYLPKLNISIESSFLFQGSTLRRLSSTLAQNFKTLKQLDLRFLSCEDLNGENFRYLLDCITKRMGSLTEINLYFLACPDVDDQSLKDIKLFILKRCKRLQRFKVVISGDVLYLNDKGFVYFEPDLDQRLQKNNLSEWTNRSNQHKITSQGGISLCRDIARYLRKLRSLTFKMASFEQENDLALEKGILKMIAGLPSLEGLNLSLNEEIKIDDEFLAELTSCIGKNLKNLQSLSLDFQDRSGITEKGYQQLAQDFFVSLPSQLTYFALNLESSTSVTDDIVREIGFSIAKNLKNLRTLILSFHDMDHLTGKALSELAKIIGKGLPSLKKLILSFVWCEGVNQSSPIILPEKMQQFDLYLYNPQILVDETWKGLNRLSLSFDECKEIISLVDLFSEHCQTLKNLNELKLIYDQSEELEDKEIENLASAIGTNLQNLTSLELGISECKSLTADSLLFLGDHICRKLKKLRHLNLSFYNAGSFYEGGLIYLTSSIISKLKKLESLTLFFYGSMGEEMNMERPLDLLCSAISRNLKGLKKLTLTFTLQYDLDLKQQIREKLCHIPVLYIY